MKKLFLSLVAAIVAATATYAQSSMLATLSHEGNISTFYGSTALRDAYNASTHGDIITLSSGSFTPVNIEKALTIRGAGMLVDTVAKTYPTIITGSFSINIPDSIEQRLTMEGLYNNFTVTIGGTLKNASFLKDRFYAIDVTGSTRIKNLTLIHSRITGFFNLPSESSASCVNCYVNNAYCRSNTSSNYEFTNCVIWNTGAYASHGNGGSGYHYLSGISSSSFTNCIIYASSNSISDILSSSNSAFYCIGKNSSNYYMFRNIPNSTNTIVSGGLSTIFKTFTGTYNDNETFELTEDAKTKYKGGDGTEVGIYGGSLPFDPTPTNPQITKCNVASKSTADGKLSVDIEVSVAE